MKQTYDDDQPPVVDTLSPNHARVYNYLLGGKANFAADRQLGEDLQEAVPTLAHMARQNRVFLGRATQFLTHECGIDQFLDIGMGIPMEPNLHDYAQEINLHSRVVYVDNDPVVLAHGRALMRNVFDQTTYIEGDLRDPEAILTDPALRMLDPDRPVGLMMLAVLMLINDDQDPWGCAKVLMDTMPSGSFVAITHLGLDFDPPAMTRLREYAAAKSLTITPRDREDVERFFDGWELINPGVVPVATWRVEEAVKDAYYWAGIARKP